MYLRNNPWLRASSLALALLTGVALSAIVVRLRADDVRRLPMAGPGPILLANSYGPAFSAQSVDELPLPSASANPYDTVPPLGGERPPTVYDGDMSDEMPWTLHWLPEGLIYRSYLAGVKEPRFGLTIARDSRFGTFWDATIGARFALVRYGTPNAYRPEGWEVDLEGAALPRLQPLEESSPLVSCDYRIGVPVTYGSGPWQFKTGYYHISAHLGDEFMILNPLVDRINYVRDSLMFGVGYFYTDNVRLFAEFDYAVGVSDGAEPCEFQFGVDYSPAVRGGAPFAAFYGNLRQEVDFGGYFVVQAGWQWRGGAALHTFRLGVQYLNGQSPQYEFFDDFEQHVSFGVWYDF